MKRLTVIILLFGLGAFERVAAPPTEQSPQELARQIIIAFQKGQVAELKGHEAKDISILEKGIKESPTDPLLHLALGSCYMGQDKVSVAQDHLEKAYKFSQKDPLAGVMYALALKMNKEPLRACEIDQELVNLHPEAPPLKVGLAAVQMTIQRYDQAITNIESLIQTALTNLPPNDRSVMLMMLGTCQLYKGNHTKAIKSLERSLSIDPRMTTDLMLLGEAYLKSGDLVKANTNLDQALARSPKITSALFYKGICAEKANDTATARKCFENAYTYQKLRLADNGEDYYLMFQICQKLSKDKEAESNKSEAAKLLFTYEAPWKN